LTSKALLDLSEDNNATQEQAAIAAMNAAKIVAQDAVT